MIPYLLHHANRSCKWPEFYAIKDRLLANAEVVGYDVQYIEGKRCHACGGSGVWHSLYSNFSDICNRCYGGWYKRPMRVLLERKRFGRFVFHKPIDRKYGNEPYEIPVGMTVNHIEGYISHSYSRYSFLAVLILFLIYDRVAAKKYFYEMGMGFRVRWWLPMNYLYVVAHFVRYGRRAYPIRQARDRCMKFIPKIDIQTQWLGNNDDLPF
jgi:hypothetical protein